MVRIFVGALTACVFLFKPVEALLIDPDYGQPAVYLPVKGEWQAKQRGGSRRPSYCRHSPERFACAQTPPLGPDTRCTLSDQEYRCGDGTRLPIYGEVGQSTVFGAEIFDSGQSLRIGRRVFDGPLQRANFSEGNHIAVYRSAPTSDRPSPYLEGGCTNSACLAEILSEASPGEAVYVQQLHSDTRFLEPRRVILLPTPSELDLISSSIEVVETFNQVLEVRYMGMAVRTGRIAFVLPGSEPEAAGVQVGDDIRFVTIGTTNVGSGMLGRDRFAMCYMSGNCEEGTDYFLSMTRVSDGSEYSYAVRPPDLSRLDQNRIVPVDFFELPDQAQSALIYSTDTVPEQPRSSVASIPQWMGSAPHPFKQWYGRLPTASIAGSDLFGGRPFNHRAPAATMIRGEFPNEEWRDRYDSLVLHATSLYVAGRSGANIQYEPVSAVQDPPGSILGRSPWLVVRATAQTPYGEMRWATIMTWRDGAQFTEQFAGCGTLFWEQGERMERFWITRERFLVTNGTVGAESSWPTCPSDNEELITEFWYAESIATEWDRVRIVGSDGQPTGIVNTIQVNDAETWRCSGLQMGSSIDGPTVTNGCFERD